VSKIYKVT